MTDQPIRLTILQTHPVQYFAPWFRWIERNCPEIEMTVLYAVTPTAEQQGVGFGSAFTWDLPLLDGYHAVFADALSDGAPGKDTAPRHVDLSSSSFRGVDIREIGSAIAHTRPDVVLIPGWHSITYMRALWWCRRRRIPVIWRGDSHDIGPSSLVRRTRTRILLRLFRYHLAVGRRTNAYLRGAGVDATRIFASPHHVDNDRFALPDEHRADARATFRAQHGIGLDEWVILWVGRLTANKRPVDVIEAASRLSPAPCVVFVGDGPLLGSCVDRARALGVRIVHTGFVNQGTMPEIYAGADVLAVTSQSSVESGRTIQETWGLVMNEALASGVPVVASEHTGGTIDLVLPGVTGERYRTGDIDSLASALADVRVAPAMAAACRAHVRRYSCTTATTGLLAACQAATARNESRILALCGGLFTATGMERVTFDILRTARARGARVHCSLNDWPEPLWPGGPTLVMDFAESVGASWSTAPNRKPLSRSMNPVRQAPIIFDSLRTSMAIWRDARSLHPTRVFAPDFISTLRALPAVTLIRMRGIPVVLKLAVAVPPSRFYHWVWAGVLNRVVTRFVTNSRFTFDSLVAAGVDRDKVLLVSHTVPFRDDPARSTMRGASVIAPVRSASPPVPVRYDHNRPLRLLFAGQIASGKGLHVLIDAVEQCLIQGHEIDLRVAGHIHGWAIPEVATYRSELQERVSSGLLDGRVRFLGFREDIGSLLDDSDLLCVPSMPELREAFGLVVIEAKQAGVASIVFPTGALPENIRHGVDGWVCDRPDAESLAEAIGMFAQSPDLVASMGLAAAQPDPRFARSTFDEKWMKILDA